MKRHKWPERRDTPALMKSTHLLLLLPPRDDIMLFSHAPKQLSVCCFIAKVVPKDVDVVHSHITDLF